jgi:hypothetical protein
MLTTDQLVSLDSIVGSRRAGCSRLSASTSSRLSGHPHRPNNRRCLPLMAMVWSLCGAMSACSSSNATPMSQSATPAAPVQSVAAAVPHAETSAASLDQVLKKDMAYADARKALLAQGWAPEKDLQCKANVGANEKLCKGTPDLNVCRICDDMPELSAYSDGGDAVMHFTQSGHRLTIDASGSISNWKVSGNDSRLSVSDWQVVK